MFQRCQIGSVYTIKIIAEFLFKGRQVFLDLILIILRPNADIMQKGFYIQNLGFIEFDGLALEADYHPRWFHCQLFSRLGQYLT